MHSLFPAQRFLPDLRPDGRPATEWVMPAPQLARRDYCRTFKRLPPGMPDCLEVSVAHSPEGTERSTAAIYDRKAYLIHYEFLPSRRSVKTQG
ncbi:hypothetical protein SAMN06265795_11617 [Noviherbaspirillum humi]|uniref:Uncharacterized protein n=1 Tax=Noviherbaspirillum humi TaxID=1688639 RepID=A0A239KHY0_9BURK|nr:hypothetical protein [Noviherbaspirillum humi]SNT17986.1 hypothetical protein SAMN06265795_11617 [Noviherbaspirillum humi]